MFLEEKRRGDLVYLNRKRLARNKQVKANKVLISKGTLFLLEKLNYYNVLLPFLIIYIGFVFVQGFIVPLENKSSLDPISNTLPISVQFYIVNGVYYIIKFSFASLLAFSVAKMLHILYEKYIRKFTVSWKKRRLLFRYLFIYIFPIAFPLIYLYIFSTGNMIKNYSSIEIFLNTIVVFLYLLSYHSLQNVIVSDQLKHEKFTGNLLVSFYIIMIFSTISLHVYFQGILTQVAKLEASLNENNGYKVAYVYIDKPEYTKNIYLKIDISKEHFIGMNPNSKTIDIIPMDKIQKIETWNVSTAKKFKKYNESNTTSKEIENVAGVIEEYYKYVLNMNKENAMKLINIVTNNYYENVMKLKSPEIIEKKAKMKKEYDDLKIDNFIGYELSVPSKMKNVNVPSSNNYEVYVVEHWLDTDRYLKFIINRVGEEWKIDSITKDNQPFDFSR